MPLPRALFRLPVILMTGFLLLSLHPAQAAYALTTGVLTGADEDVTEQSPTDTSGGRTFLEFRSRNISGTERHRIAFFRFDTTGMTLKN